MLKILVLYSIFAINRPWQKQVFAVGLFIQKPVKSSQLLLRALATLVLLIKIQWQLQV